MSDTPLATPDQRNALMHLVLECVEDAAQIICGRTYGYGLVGTDLERVGQATKVLLHALNDAQWVLADPARWQALQTQLHAEEAQSDPAFRDFMRSLS